MPRVPGPLRAVDEKRGRPSDEVDEAIDDLFGDTTDERPGGFDLALIVGGLALAGWGALMGGSVVLGGLGVVLLLLGTALPARSVVQAVQRRRDVVRRRHMAATGYLLDASHPATADLVDAYEALLVATTLPGVRLADDALDAAHQALVEVATLLAGGVPVAPAEIDYVERRAEAVRALSAGFVAAHRAECQRTEADPALVADARLERASALASARDELETIDPTSSIDRLTNLRLRVQPETDDAGG